MSNRQERNARKLAVRNGDTSQQFFHEAKRPTQPAPTRERRERDRKSRAHLRSLMRNPIEALAQINKAVDDAEAKTKKS